MRLLLTVCLLFVASSADAYIGPGAGISVIGSLFTWIAGLLLAIFAVLFYPFRLIFRRMRKRMKEQQGETESGSEPAASGSEKE